MKYPNTETRVYSDVSVNLEPNLQTPMCQQANKPTHTHTKTKTFFLNID